jgi:hypothetical protein
MSQLRKATPIKSTDNFFGIFDNGDVINFKTNNILKHSLIDGYPCLCVVFSGRKTTIRIHRELAIAFIPNPENKLEVNHKDGNRGNFSIENLEWVTRSENELHAFRELGKKANSYWTGKKGKENKSSKPVKQFDLDGNLVNTYSSVVEAGKSGFSISHISLVCNGKEKSHKNFIWKY